MPLEKFLSKPQLRQNKQFLGSGEFTLEFGNYKVEITAPNDHIVAATGELQNAKAVMSDTQIKRWNEAKKSDEITFIVTPEEAKKNQSKKTKSTKSKTWVFKADNVRDFAWASSRKFIWDAKYHSKLHESHRHYHHHQKIM